MGRCRAIFQDADIFQNLGDGTAARDAAIALARLPVIRGFGPVKEKAIVEYAMRRAELLSHEAATPLNKAT